MTRHSFFWADDYLYLQLSELHPMSVSFLRRANFGHFAPITSTIYWISQKAFPLNFGVAHFFTASVYLGCTACLAALLRRLAGPRPAVYIALAWFGVSIFSLRVLDWFASSVHIYVALLFSLLCLVFFVRWYQEGRPRDRWLSVVAFAGALLVQERPLLVPMYLVLLRYVIMEPDRLSFATTLRSIRRDLRVWFPYAAVSVAALAHLLVFYSGNAGRPDFGTFTRFLRLSFSQGFFPGVVGSHYFEKTADAGWRPSFALAQCVGAALVIGVIAFSFTRRRAGRAWFFAGVTYGSNMLLLASGRRDVFDPLGRATDIQYYIEVHLFFCLAVALAYRGETRFRRHLGWRPAANLALAVIVAVVAANTARGARDMVRVVYHPRVAHEYVDGVRQGFARIDRSGPAEVLPLRAPGSVAFEFIVPYDDHLTFLRLFPGLPTRNVDSSNKFVVDEHGAVRPVLPYLHESAYRDPAFEISGSVEQGPVDAGGERCFVPGKESTINVPLRSQATGGALFAALDYTSDRAQTVIVAQDLGGGEISYRSWPQTLPPGRHVAYLGLQKETADRVYLLGLGRSIRFCMRGLDVVSLVFADRRDLDGRCPEVSVTGGSGVLRPCDGRFRKPSGVPTR